MNTETRLGDLLSIWERERQAGRELTAQELCRDQPELAAELERRIAAVKEMNRLALAPTATVEQAVTELKVDSWSTLPPDPAEKVARIAAIPGYEIISELGRGGMGVVYKARQIGLNRIVALKMILAGGHAGEAELVRFRTEAEAIARLQHPNIVQIFEVGQQDGLPYFSLEFCAKGSLAQKLAGTPLPPREAAELVETLARAMHAAHEKGVIHRDLKPANVLLAEDGTPKITDFGLARKLDEEGRTATGAIMGTPSYMAPEQAEGKVKELGPAVDVYSLGAILYECLIGRPPFKAVTPLDTMLLVVSQEPVSVRQLQPQIPRDLETICHKCLRKEPGKRYADAKGLADDLNAFLEGRPITARPIGPAERTWRLMKQGWKWCHCPEGVRSAGIVMICASLAFLLSGIWNSYRLMALLPLVMDNYRENWIDWMQLTFRHLWDRSLYDWTMHLIAPVITKYNSIEQLSKGAGYARPVDEFFSSASQALLCLYIGRQALKQRIWAIWAGVAFALTLLIASVVVLVTQLADSPEYRYRQRTQMNAVPYVRSVEISAALFSPWTVVVTVNVIVIHGYYAGRKRAQP